MTSASAVFVDTNILIYATNPLSPWHRMALDALNHHRGQRTELVISTQVLREYLAAATRLDPEARRPPSRAVLTNVKAFESEFRVMEDRLLVFQRLIEIIDGVPGAGRQIHDANIVATMQVYGIQLLLTHNVAHFRRFTGLINLVPLVEGNPG